jgi:methyl coenzyme M reductase gamma subunit
MARNPLDDLPRIHPRESMVRAAESRVRNALANETHGLTEGERLRVIAAVFGDAVGSIAKLAIREERHGDPDKPGGEE